MGIDVFLQVHRQIFKDQIQFCLLQVQVLLQFHRHDIQRSDLALPLTYSVFCKCHFEPTLTNPLVLPALEHPSGKQYLDAEAP